mgnify:CR=1 FL=1
MRLKDKIAIVTGGAKGIGRSIALALAKEGANIVIADLDEGQGKKTASEIEVLGRRTLVVKCDVRLLSDIDNLVKRTVEVFGRIDILCNNAGVSTMNRLLDVTEKDYDFNMDVNAKGVFFCSQAVARQMIKQGGQGKIVNTASIAGFSGGTFLSDYNASKAACIIHTMSFAMELAKHKINVNAVCPGLVRTSMQEREIQWESELTGRSIEEIKRRYLEVSPLGRLEEPEDVAKVVVFLASDDADFITGEAIKCDGGLLMHI